MPVTATPAAADPTCPAPAIPNKPADPAPAETCCEQNQTFPVTPTYMGEDIRGRIASVTVQACQKAILRWQMLDQNGRPLSLTGCFAEPPPDESSSLSSSESSAVSQSSVSSTSSESLDTVGTWVDGTVPGDCNPNFDVLFSMREQLSIGGVILDAEVSVENVEQGIVRVNLSPDNLASPGVYFAEFGIYDMTDPDNPVRHYSNMFYMFIEPQISLDQLQGTPSIAEVRLFLRDSSPVENLLLDEAKFSDSEIIMATRLPVQEWNETPPPIQTYTTQNFPFRMHWLGAICGYLFRMAAEQYRANRLPVSAGGISIDDQNKESNYDRVSDARIAEWRKWMRFKKGSLNLEQGYGGIGSQYATPRRGYY